MPQQEHGEKPTKFCSPSHLVETEGGVRCNRGAKGSSCLAYDKGAGCKDGERMQETQLCNSYCWKDMCSCCKVLQRHQK